MDEIALNIIDIHIKYYEDKAKRAETKFERNVAEEFRDVIINIRKDITNAEEKFMESNKVSE